MSSRAEFLDKVDSLNATLENNECASWIYSEDASYTWGRGYINNNIFWGNVYYSSWWGLYLTR